MGWFKCQKKSSGGNEPTVLAEWTLGSANPLFSDVILNLYNQLLSSGYNPKSLEIEDLYNMKILVTANTFGGTKFLQICRFSTLSGTTYTFVQPGDSSNNNLYYYKLNSSSSKCKCYYAGTDVSSQGIKDYDYYKPQKIQIII